MAPSWDWYSLLQAVLTFAFDTTWDLITPENIAQAMGALAAFLAVVISLTHIVRHWKFNRTKLRKSTVRLLFVVPIFAIDCWACLMLEASVFNWAELLTCLREVYEAVALVSFMELVLTILGGSAHLASTLATSARLKDPQDPPPVHHVWPIRKVIKPYKAGAEFVRHMLLGIFQYVFVCLAYLVMVYMTWALHVLGFLGAAPTAVIKACINVMKAGSCAWALNCLLLFAHEVYEHVPACGLALKFLSIKGIVFFTFWQGFVIFCLQRTGFLESAKEYISERSARQGLDPEWWDEAQLKSGLNDLLLCFEVLFFSVLHLFAYPAREVERLPPHFKANVLDDSQPGVERVLSAVNLMNISRLRREVSHLSEEPNGHAPLHQSPTAAGDRPLLG